MAKKWERNNGKKTQSLEFLEFGEQLVSMQEGFEKILFTCTDDDDIAFSVLVKVLEVAGGHRA